MRFLDNQLQTIKKKFPQQSDRIEELYFLDEDFRSLCTDYLLCLRELRKFHKETCEKKLSIKEYKNVRVVLEDELSYFLSRPKVYSPFKIWPINPAENIHHLEKQNEYFIQLSAGRQNKWERS